VDDLEADVGGVEESGNTSLVGRDLGLLHDGDIGTDVGDEGELDGLDALDDVNNANQDVGNVVIGEVRSGLVDSTVAGGDVDELLLEIVLVVSNDDPVGLGLVVAHIGDGLIDSTVSGDAGAGSGSATLALEAKVGLLDSRVLAGRGGEAPLLK